MATTTHDAMYQTIGGAAGLTKVVDNFYERLWADPELRHYFDNIDKAKLKEHQRAFLTFALGGGTDAYSGKPLNQAHADLHITHAAFDKVAWHLKLTLEELDVDRPLISIILGFVEGARSQVINPQGF
jgi:hemoglobin